MDNRSNSSRCHASVEFITDRYSVLFAFSSNGEFVICSNIPIFISDARFKVIMVTQFPFWNKPIVYLGVCSLYLEKRSVSE